MWKEKQSVDPDQLIWVYTDFKIGYRILKSYMYNAFLGWIQ